MQYSVNVLTKSIDRSHDDYECIRNHHIPAHNREDARRMCDALSDFDGGRIHEDGPFLIERVYEVCVTIYGSRVNGKTKVVLSESDLQYIVSEFHRSERATPARVAAE